MGTLICTVELNKESGITVTVKNGDANITQTITMNGTSIVIKVAGQSDTSTITQTADAVAVTCKKFSVTADEQITMKSSGTAAYESDKTTSVKAGTDLTIDGNTVKATGTQSLAAKGSQSSLSLDSSGAKLSTPSTATIQGQGQLSMSGGVVQVSADGMLTAEAQAVLTLKGAIANLQGNLVNLG